MSNQTQNMSSVFATQARYACAMHVDSLLSPTGMSYKELIENLIRNNIYT